MPLRMCVSCGKRCCPDEGIDGPPWRCVECDRWEREMDELEQRWQEDEEETRRTR